MCEDSVQIVSPVSSAVVRTRIAVGAESKYFYSPSHPIKVDGHLRDGTLQGVFASVSLRVYLFDFGR